MSELRVLLVNATFGGASGSGRHVRLLYEYLKDRVDFTIWHVGNVGYLNFPKLKSLSFYLRLKRKDIPKEIDIVHIHNPKFAGIIPRHRDKIYVVTVHGGLEEFEHLYGYVGRTITHYLENRLREADIVTTVSPYTAKIKGWYYIPNMVPLEEIDGINPAAERHLLYVGRRSKVKGYHLFRAVAERFPELSPLALGVERVAPWEEVISLMKSAYALILPSEWEGFPSVVLEAWACGCPVIASDIPPLQILSTKALFLVPRTVKAFSRAVEELIHDEQLRGELVEGGYKEVQKYEAKKVTGQYYELYKRLISRKSCEEYK